MQENLTLRNHQDSAVSCFPIKTHVYFISQFGNVSDTVSSSNFISEKNWWFHQCVWLHLFKTKIKLEIYEEA